MPRRLRSGLAQYLGTLRVNLLRESSPVLIGIYTVVFGLFGTESIQRAMEQILPQGVSHLETEGPLWFMLRGAAMGACFLTLCICFIHGSAVTIRMQLRGGMVSIYARTLFVFSLALAPWCGLHVGRIVLAPFVPAMRSWTSPLFLVVYGAWLGLNWGLVWVVTRLKW